MHDETLSRQFGYGRRPFGFGGFPLGFLGGLAAGALITTAILLSTIPLLLSIWRILLLNYIKNKQEFLPFSQWEKVLLVMMILFPIFVDDFPAS